MARYVILTHDHPFPHWDLLLEGGSGGWLHTWRLLEEPQPGCAVPAEALADHRPVYLDYTGPISGGRGTVARWDWGEFDRLASDTSLLEVTLRGQRQLSRARLLNQGAGLRWVFDAAAAPAV